MSAAKIISALAWHVVLIVVGIVMNFPLVWAVVTSLKTPSQIYSTQIVANPMTLENYVFAWTKSGLPNQLLNTFWMAILVAIGQTVVSASAAYALAYFKPRWGKLIFAGLAGAIVIPAQVLIIPQFLLANSLHWKNTMAGLVVPQLATCALQVLITYQHAAGLPKGMINAARLEGANAWEMFADVVLPNLRSALGAVFILAFISSWNEYLWPLLISDEPNRTTVQIGLQMFFTAEGTDFGGLLAAAVISTAPILILYVLASRQITNAFLKAGSA